MITSKHYELISFNLYLKHYDLLQATVSGGQQPRWGKVSDIWRWHQL